MKESMPILNACTKKSGNLLKTPRIYIYLKNQTRPHKPNPRIIGVPITKMAHSRYLLFWVINVNKLLLNKTDLNPPLQ